MIGRTLAHYKVLEEISRGGMGIVYKALDLKLNREVALKLLPSDLVSNDERKRRFVQEAQAAAAIKHPNIAVVYDIDEADGETFMAIELIEGDTLGDYMRRDQFTPQRALEIALGIAAGLGAAHKMGIVHRDLKPSNIMITDEGHPKIIDFGLAKLVEPLDSPESEAHTVAKEGTHPGELLGTFDYMSPEQTRGGRIDPRSDVFSFGVVLYQMLAGKPLFRRASPADTMSAILRDDAPPLSVSSWPAKQNQKLQGLLDRCLAKQPAERFDSAQELFAALSDVSAGQEPSLWSRLREPRLALPLIFGLLLVVVAAAVGVRRSVAARQARFETIPEIMRLVEADDYTSAYALAESVESDLGDDPILRDLWSRFAVRTTIETEPPGVEVAYKLYSEPESEWTSVGRTPIESVRLPRSVLRWKFEKAGYESARRSGGAFNGTIRLRLAEGNLPGDMVRIPTENVDFLLTGFNPKTVEVPRYLIGRYEVTNGEFREFVEAGGYRDQGYWDGAPFDKDGQGVSWSDAVAEFRDQTGRPGPATWEGGIYPDGEEDFPVRGVSWYEAAAYAAFRGKTLPTIYHWSRAALWPLSGEAEADTGEVVAMGAFRSMVVNLSNFSDRAAPVGAHSGVGPYGTYDMAGNVREWSWNATGDSPGSDRYILVGAWSDPSYLYTYGVAQSPWDRSEKNGFRLVHRASGDDVEHIAASVELPGQEEIPPVSDEIFDVYRDLYAYDRTDLNPTIDAVDDASEHWRQETISFDATYGNERVIAHLFLPKGVDPPFQVVAYYPSSDAISHRSSAFLQMDRIDFIIMSGRAVVYPVLVGTYERNIGLETTWPDDTRAYSDRVVQWIQDFRRTVDFVETRDDIDLERLAFHGFSWGGWNGPIVLALDDRFKTGVFVSGGIPPTLARPEASSASFASRVTQPVLMISGKNDILRPVETFQRPMFASLGTADEDKRHAILDSGHIPPRNQLIRETLDWLDRYLGPVN